MITIFGSGESISYEEVGAIELLKSQGASVNVVLSDSDGDSELHSARTVFSQFGVEVFVYERGGLRNSEAVVSFGRPELFNLVKRSGERPKKIIYGLPKLVASQVEVKALSSGFIDEVFVPSPRRAAASVRDLVKRASCGVEFRQGYAPFCNPDSDFCKMYFVEKRDPSVFSVLRDTPDSPLYTYPNYWATASSITVPLGKEKVYTALGWGKQLSKVAGDPTERSCFWNQLLTVTSISKPSFIDESAPHYKDANVLFHYFPADDVFSFSVAKAMLTGVVVVGTPLPAFTDVLSHGETGFIARSPDEASYFASKLAWEPQLRLDMAAKAHNWFVTKGAGNPDNCFNWWAPLFK